MKYANTNPAARRVPAGPLFEGVATGETVTHRKLAMVRLMGEDRPGPAYVLLNDAMSAGLASVREVSEGGSVPDLLLENRADKPLLALDGQELVGARQNRVLNLSLLLRASSKTVVPVSCVEQGRWSYSSREFRPSQNMVFASAKMSKGRHVTENLRESGSRHSDQGDVWDHVQMKLSKMGSSSATMAMDEVFRDFDTDLDAFGKALEPVAGQRGALFLVDGALAGLELFDRASTLAAMHGTLTRSYAMDALERERDAPEGSFRKDDPDAFLSLLRGTTAEAWPSVGLGEDWRFSGDQLQLAALVVDGLVLHASAFPGMAADHGRRLRDFD
jgi:hypothetical protein